jgi:hypothetical protein
VQVTVTLSPVGGAQLLGNANAVVGTNAPAPSRHVAANA